MDIKTIESIATTMVGEHVGWKARFADTAGISRTHVSNVFSGERPVTADFQARLWVACERQSAILRVRAAALTMAAAELKKAMPPEVAASPVAYTRKQYETEAEEAEDIIKGMAGVADDGERS